MNDSYPQNFEISIEREKLCRYLRLRAFLCWASFFVFVSTFIGISASLGKISRHYLDSVQEFWSLLAFGVCIGVSSGLLLSLLLYFLVNHRSTKQNANALAVAVEGQYLRVTEGVIFRRDRRLHFRAIVDFTCFQGPLMRWCGISGIAMNTTANGINAIVNILAVKDALSVRDTLSKIDRLREDQEPT